MATPPPPNMNYLAGPQLLGFLFSWGLQGALSVQVYMYHMYFPKDKLHVKALVYLVFIWEWVQTGLLTSMAYDIDVLSFGDISSVTGYHNTWFSIPIMTAVISFVVQNYFAWRIYILSRSKILVGSISLFAFAQMALCISGGIILHVIKADAAKASLNKPIIAAGLVIATVVDVVIAAAMTFYLLRSKTGLRKSDNIVNGLVRLTIETGALTAIVALLYVVLSTAVTDNLLFEPPAAVLPKLYSNSLIMSLNNRVFVRGAKANPLAATTTNGDGAGVTSFSTYVREQSNPALKSGGRPEPQPELHVHVARGLGDDDDDASMVTKGAMELVSMGSRT